MIAARVLGAVGSALDWSLIHLLGAVSDRVEGRRADCYRRADALRSGLVDVEADVDHLEPGQLDKPPAVEFVSVSDLYVNCSYPIRPNAVALSDCCQGSAMSAVESEGGDWLWRCRLHLGLVREGVEGRVRFAVTKPGESASAAVVTPAADNTTDCGCGSAE